MMITVVGAAGGEVTGSAYLVEIKQARVLVDYGLFQDGKRVESKKRVTFSRRQQIFTKISFTRHRILRNMLNIRRRCWRC